MDLLNVVKKNNWVYSGFIEASSLRYFALTRDPLVDLLGVIAVAAVLQDTSAKGVSFFCIRVRIAEKPSL